MSNMNKQYRQGDVLLVEVPRIPDDAHPVPREDGRVVLAHGEATGHAHAVLDRDADLLERPDGDLFLRVATPSAVTHEEHDPVAIGVGAYRVVRQREYLPGAWMSPDRATFVGD